MAGGKEPKESSDSIIDMFQAVKRAITRRGFLYQKFLSKKTTSNDRNSTKLSDVTEVGHDLLFKANTVFPFTLFPDTVTLDREKITFATRYFFGVAKITSVPVRDILSVEADIGPFFGSVHTASRYFITKPHSVNFLSRSDALQLQRLLQGYIIAHEREIDCTSIEKDKLIILLNDLGQGDTS